MMTPSDYLTLYKTCAITQEPNKLKELEYICGVVLSNTSQYIAVQLETGIPWPVIAAVHYRESDQNFKCHLHNGDPLSSRTVHVPANRPQTGVPPFLWQESAVDALGDRWRPEAWDIASCLAFLERYNGTGYQKHGVNTPYLWDYTNHYVSGLYVSDGTFRPDVKESRPGAVPVLLSLEQKGVSLDFTHSVIH